MAVKRSYNRYFIIFQEEDRGFGTAIDKQPTGYTKIETRNGRCKITSYVQNLLKDRGPYVCCMIDATQNPPVLARLGEIKVDDTGRGETWWEFREEDIAETGLSFDRFNVSAIIIEGDRMYAPLAGYMGREKTPWKDRLMQLPRASDNEDLKKDEKEEIVEEETDEEAKKFKEYEEKISKGDFERATEAVEKNEKKANESKTDSKSKPDDKLRDIDTIKDMGEAGNQSRSNEDDTKLYAPNENIKENMKKESKKAPYFSDNFHRALDKFNEVDILNDDMRGSRWWRIPYDENTYIEEDENYPYCCTVYHLQMTYPYINYVKYFRKRGYYYFGLNYDEDGEVKQIMYGIEGKNSPKEQPYMGMTGFIKWMKIKDRDKGLWVMYYNPYTGCVMIPKKR